MTEDARRVHLGCGDRFLPGYIHVDVRPDEHVDHVTDIKWLPFFEDGSISEIYAAHVLEHFGRHEVEAVVTEWCRVLGSGGTLRLAVPDFQAIAEQYVENGDLEQYLGLLYGGQDYDQNYHRVAFDFVSMERLLEGCGLTEVERYDWWEFLPDGFDDFSRAYLPHMDFEAGRLMSLNVVARKP